MTRGNKHKCYYCGQNEDCTRDHFYPKSIGGKLCVYACSLCQSSKKDKMPNDWLVYLQNHVLINKTTLTRIETAVKTLAAMKDLEFFYPKSNKS